MRVELIAEHGQLRGRRLAFQPQQLIALLLDQYVEIDPVIERRPRREQGEVEQDRGQ